MKSEMRRAMVGWVSMALMAFLVVVPLLPMALTH
jgi:hypothetical protein